jgi:hypothetical protein
MSFLRDWCDPGWGRFFVRQPGESLWVKAHAGIASVDHAGRSARPAQPFVARHSATHGLLYVAEGRAILQKRRCGPLVDVLAETVGCLICRPLVEFLMRNITCKPRAPARRDQIDVKGSTWESGGEFLRQNFTHRSTILMVWLTTETTDTKKILSSVVYQRAARFEIFWDPSETMPRRSNPSSAARAHQKAGPPRSGG